MIELAVDYDEWERLAGESFEWGCEIVSGIL